MKNLASVYVALVEPGARNVSQQEVMTRARNEILAKLPPELRTSAGEVAAISAGASSTAAIQWVVSGPDLAKLSEIEKFMSERIRKAPGVVDFDTNLIIGQPEHRVAVDRDRAADLGVNVADVAETLLTQIGA